ncbi:MAG: hypothetical protein WC405_19480 [Syntrophales bacterium]
MAYVEQESVGLRLGAIAGTLRGQGATEYLVLLAVVLIVALVSISLLGFFPGMASDAKITQSQSYWRGEARPFAILEHTVAGSTGVATIVIQNVDAMGTYTMTNLTINASKWNTTSTPFAPGEVKNLRFTGSQVLPTGTSGDTYDFPVIITYTSPNNLVMKQHGAKNIMGKYT